MAGVGWTNQDRGYGQRSLGRIQRRRYRYPYHHYGLELRIPHGADWAALVGLVPSLLTYVMSFVYLAIYWNNHHHLLYTVARVDGLILWANSHLLFWLSLIPAATAWMGENLSAPVPTAVYGGALLMPAIAYYLLQKAIVHGQGAHSVLARALGSDIKDIYAEAKSAGFDVKVLRQLIRIRKQEPADVEEQETLLDVYRRALGM